MGLADDGEGGPPAPIPEAPERTREPGLPLAALSAVGALVVSLIYVLLNSAYLEFYESLGVRPEEVGLDRLAILGRASGLALIALLLAGLVDFLILSWWSLKLGQRTLRFIPRRFRPGMEWAPERADRAIRLRIVAPAVVLSVGLVFAALATTAATIAVGRDAERAEDGIPVGPLRVGPVLLVDVSADAARAYWLDKEAPRPQLLDDPWLLYLGSSDRVVVFVACGTTVIVPADKVMPEVLTTRKSREAQRGSATARSDACAKLEP
jgi:hypothetical protein